MDNINKIYVGGAVVDQWGTFKRNKSDIIKNIKIEGAPFQLIENIAYFYNKALIYQNQENKKNIVLISYNTAVAEIKNDSFIIYGYYSPTTARHINAFMDKNGLVNFSKKEIENIKDQWQKMKYYKKGV